jgi:UDP-GlcNAc:undecaprenyl-phosphate GlcNAc-1-phosphate transferase
MGDSGSLFIGLVLAWFVIDLSQGDTSAIAPVQGLWFLMVP